MRSEVITMVIMNSVILQDVTSSTLVDVYRCFGRKFCLESKGTSLTSKQNYFTLLNVWCSFVSFPGLLSYLPDYTASLFLFLIYQLPSFARNFRVFANSPMSPLGIPQQTPDSIFVLVERESRSTNNWMQDRADTNSAVIERMKSVLHTETVFRNTIIP